MSRKKDTRGTSSPKATEKHRKTTDGPIRNKERTRRKLIDAVGKLFAKEGYTSLNAAKIAATARLDRKLIYLYFGSVDELIECYLSEQDYWKPERNSFIAELLQSRRTLKQEDMLLILKGQLDAMLKDKSFQKLIQWELSQKNEMLRQFAEDRDQMGEQLFALTDAYFSDRDADLRAVLALQVAGIYYLALHARVNGSNFCGIDVRTPEGKERIEAALGQILKDTYAKKKVKK